MRSSCGILASKFYQLLFTIQRSINSKCVQSFLPHSWSPVRLNWKFPVTLLRLRQLICIKLLGSQKDVKKKVYQLKNL